MLKLLSYEPKWAVNRTESYAKNTYIYNEYQDKLYNINLKKQEDLKVQPKNTHVKNKT